VKTAVTVHTISLFNVKNGMERQLTG